MVLRSFNLWYIKNFFYKGDFDVDYQWFSTYEMVSSWSMNAKLACPYCMENNKAFTLTNGGKAFFFTATVISFQWITGIETRHSCLSGEELHDVVSEYDDIVFVFNLVSRSFPVLVWPITGAKRIIFWELPYWKTNFFRHNLDIMHIKKSIWEHFQHRHGCEGEDKGQHQG